MRVATRLVVSVSSCVLFALAFPLWAAPAPTATLAAGPTAPAGMAAPTPLPGVMASNASLVASTPVASSPAVAGVENPALGTRLLPIGAARRLPVGTRVTVEGSVTVPSGVFSSSFGDQGFAIQDATGGVYVSTVENLGLGLQQRVRVTGLIADGGGLISVVPADASGVTVDGKAFRVRPVWVRTGHVGPPNQGLLIYVVGTITAPIEPDPPYGMKVFVNDGSGELRVFINTSADIDISGLAPGQFLSVTGFSGAFDTPELDPRFQRDIKQPAAPH